MKCRYAFLEKTCVWIYIYIAPCRHSKRPVEIVLGQTWSGTPFVARLGLQCGRSFTAQSLSWHIVIFAYIGNSLMLGMERLNWTVVRLRTYVLWCFMMFFLCCASYTSAPTLRQIDVTRYPTLRRMGRRDDCPGRHQRRWRKISS